MSLEDLSFEQRDELAALARQLAENPQTRKEFLRLTKKAKPDLPIPELEIEDYTHNAISNSNKRVEELEAKLREKEILEDLDKRRNKLMKKGLVNSDEDIAEVEKVMLEKGITNHEAAAEYWQWMKQSATPSANPVFNQSAMSKFDLSQYWKNPKMAAQNEAAKALMELRKNPKPIGL
ncbi:hypothetical protein [Bacteriophage sp.]|nr:hypothetical protein [Bacteriophage sp.]